MGEIDWTRLRAAARAAVEHAYAPYSRFPVGAAALARDGRVISGCNVENASYGLTLCAECGLISALYARPDEHDPVAGAQRPMLVAVVVVDGQGAALPSCGRCRQLLWEHGGPNLLVETADGVRPMSEILPDAFGPADLEGL